MIAENKMAIEFEYTDDADDDDIAEVEISAGEDEEKIEEIEFSLTDEEIDEWVNDLIMLKEEQGKINLRIDDSLYLKINHQTEEE